MGRNLTSRVLPPWQDFLPQKTIGTTPRPRLLLIAYTGSPGPRLWVFALDWSKCRLALLSGPWEQRGLGATTPLIDEEHRSMMHWKAEKRRDLIAYLVERGLSEDGPFWKLA